MQTNSGTDSDLQLKTTHYVTGLVHTAEAGGKISANKFIVA